jgi:hypothetical protein
MPKVCPSPTSSVRPCADLLNYLFKVILIRVMLVSLPTISAMNKSLHVTKGLLNWVKIGRIRWQEAYLNPLSLVYRLRLLAVRRELMHYLL